MESDHYRLMNMQVFKSKYIWFALLAYGIKAGTMYSRISDAQPTPYMDEIFHVPQCQKYCQGLFAENDSVSFKWDPKITTLPGTYIITAGVLRAMSRVFSIPDICQTTNLRMFNFITSFFNMSMIFYIVGLYYPEYSMSKRAMIALNLASFSVLYFFSFLYYTDAISTATLLLMHSFYLNNNFKSSAVAGALSVLTRQTNIIWVFYHGMCTVLEVLYGKYGDQIFTYPTAYWKYLKMPTPPPPPEKEKPKKGKWNKKVNKKPKPPQKPPFHLPSFSRICRDCGKDLVCRGMGYVIVGMVFMAFVIYNGGIVVGDKDAHQVTLNFPQLGYFALLFGGFTLSFIYWRFNAIMKLMLVHKKLTLFVTLMFVLIVYNGSPVHPYLLADNRHYTFYIWRRFYAKFAFLPYVWIPFYVLVWAMIVTSMGTHPVYIYTYLFCTALSVVPQLLLEFRYFIPAYLFARLTFKNTSWRELILEFLVSGFINTFTVYVFIHRSFRWPGSFERQRFMW